VGGAGKSRRRAAPAPAGEPVPARPVRRGAAPPGRFPAATYPVDFGDDASLRAILAHELAHLARRDCAWMLLARFACALLWPQPLIWLLCRLLTQATEEACDQEVLREAGCSPRTYARCLLALAERLAPLPPHGTVVHAGAAATEAVAFRSSLGRRVHHILQSESAGTPAPCRPSPRLRSAAGLFAAGAAGALPLLVAAVGSAAAPVRRFRRVAAAARRRARPAGPEASRRDPEDRDPPGDPP
jgi:hypothetical protein